MLKLLRRIWERLNPPEEWRVVQHSDGRWYVEIHHIDQDWVYQGDGHEFMSGAAAEGRKLFERKQHEDHH
jgi:hypothetical protein